jgi:hypothetical protein
LSREPRFELELGVTTLESVAADESRVAAPTLVEA